MQVKNIYSKVTESVLASVANADHSELPDELRDEVDNVTNVMVGVGVHRGPHQAVHELTSMITVENSSSMTASKSGLSS